MSLPGRPIKSTEADLSLPLGLLLVSLSLLPGLIFLFLYPYLGQPMRFFYRDGWGLSERAEWSIYLLGWPLGVAITTILSCIILWQYNRLSTTLKSRYLKSLVLINASLSFLAVALQFIMRGEKELFQAPVWFKYRDLDVLWAQPKAVIILYFTAFLTLNALLVSKFVQLNRTAKAIAVPSRFDRLSRLLWLLPLFVAGYIVFIYGYPVARALRGTDYYAAMQPILLEPPDYKWAWILAILSGLLGLAYQYFRNRIPTSRKLALTAEIAALALFSLLLIDITFPAEPWHTKVYVLPVNGILHGHSAPNEINALYGAGMSYFLAGLFKTGLIPFSLSGMSAVNSLMMVALYLTLYFTLRVATGHRIISFLAALGAAAWIYHGYYIVYPEYHPAMFAQGPPLRIIIPALLMLVVAIRIRRATRRTELWYFAIEGLLIGLSSVWSLEALCYTLPAVAALLITDYALDTRPRRKALEIVGLRIGLILLGGALFHGLLILHNFTRTGRLPGWSSYLSLIKSTSATDGPVVPWGPWQVATTILFGGAMWTVYSIIPQFKFPRIKMLPVLAGFTALGIAHFTYYLGFSMSFRIGYVLYAPLAIAALVTSVAMATRHPLPHWVRGTISFLFFAGTLLPVLLFILKPATVNPFNYSLLKALLMAPVNRAPLQTAISTLQAPVFSSDKPRELIRLIDKYSPDASRLPLFVDDITRMDVLLAKQKDYIYPLASIEHDGSDNINIERIRNTPPDLKAGDIIYTQKEPQLGIIQNLLLDLNKNFWMETLETTPMGLQVQKLHSNNEPEPDELAETSGTIVRLADLDLQHMQQGYDRPQKDTSVAKNPLSIAGRKFRFGIGSHSPSALLINLNKNVSKFQAFVGVDDESSNGTVDFEVIKDGQSVYKSPLMRTGTTAEKVSIDLKDASQLKLLIHNGGDNSGYDHADWGDAKLYLIDPNGPKPETLPLPAP